MNCLALFHGKVKQEISSERQTKREIISIGKKFWIRQIGNQP